MLGKCWVNVGKTIKKCWGNVGKCWVNVGLMLVKQKKCWVDVGKCWVNVGLMLVNQFKKKIGLMLVKCW
jgi:hypothetical protein